MNKINELNDIKLIGEGTYSKVYKYTCNDLSKTTFVLKRIRYDIYDVTTIKEIAALKYLNNVKYFPIINEIKINNRKASIIMNYHGINILSFSKKLSNIKREDIFSLLISQLISGLKFLQDHKIFNVDIKCENILIDDDNKLTIIDFNLSFFGHNKQTEQIINLTCGTSYMQAPEKPNFIIDKTYSWYIGIISFYYFYPHTELESVSFNCMIFKLKLINLTIIVDITSCLILDASLRNSLKKLHLNYGHDLIKTLIIKKNKISNINNNWFNIDNRNIDNRDILIKWLKDVIVEVEINNQELILAKTMDIIDQYVDSHAIKLSDYQLLGIVSLFIIDSLINNYSNNYSNLTIDLMMELCVKQYNHEQFDLMIKTILLDNDLFVNEIN
jgi:serine/threonine protein kinase